MEFIVIKDDYIKLGQALKLAGVAQSGIEAKFMIIDGEVKYNGEVEIRRGKKVYEGDIIEVGGQVFKVTK